MGPWSRTVVLLVTTISAAVLSTPLNIQRRENFFDKPLEISDETTWESAENIEPENHKDLNIFHTSNKIDYTGAQVWKVSTENGKREVVSELEHKNLISIWKIMDASVHILILADDIQNVKTALMNENLPFEIVIKDLQELINLENPPFDENEIKRHKSVGHSMDWKQYHRLEDIYGYLDYLAKSYPTIVSVKSIGKTFEGRDLKIIKISNGNPSNKAVFIDGGIHAREWISPATVTYFINQIAENFNAEDDNVKNTDWYFLPVFNPDGYEYAHTNDRMWRKNRRPTETSAKQSCFGVDINRNFGFKWGGKGTSASPCSQTYKGEEAFSEPESKAVRDFFQSSGVKFNVYLTYHSFSQYILHPWGYDDVLPPDAADLAAAGNKMAEAIKAVGNDIYQVGSSTKLVGAAAGASDDWAKSFGVKYSYTVELNDKGKYGFILPPEFIEPVAKENLAGLRALLAVIHEA